MLKSEKVLMFLISVFTIILSVPVFDYPPGLA
jgi:hypothetical protein